MDDDVDPTMPAPRIRHALAAAGVEVVQLWWEYLRLGGQATAVDIEAYLRHNLWLPPDGQALLVQAAAGLLRPAPEPCAPEVVHPGGVMGSRTGA